MKNPNTERIYAVHADHLNTPRLVTDAQNRIIWCNGPLAEPFGNALPEEDPDGDGRDFVLNLRFPGQYYDRETNTHYNYFRDYDPLTGRYLQSDPIGLNGGINTYAYANGNPLTYTDPEGLLSIAACSHPMNAAACAAAGIGVAASVVPKPGYVPAPMPIPKGKEWCEEDEREDCENECVKQYERDADECVVARAFWGGPGYRSCMSRAGEYLGQCMRMCDGK